MIDILVSNRELKYTSGSHRKVDSFEWTWIVQVMRSAMNQHCHFHLLSSLVEFQLVSEF